MIRNPKFQISNFESRISNHLSALIREEAFRLGFFKIGIAPAGPLPLSAENNLNTYLERGFHGEMDYLARQASKRRDLRAVFAEARTILVLGLNYYAGDSIVDAPMKGRISRYAQGEDYHPIVKNRLNQLLRYIQSLEPSARGICYADTGAIMEKTWGDQTSLGWLGKNTNLITRSGSWFFIGIILLNIDLEWDHPGQNRCGTCRRCMDSCPTGAIVAPYVLDSRLCISYLTIELRGPIPRSLRPLMGNRIFGCDDCQECCPWNRFACKTTEAGFSGKEEPPDLLELIQISADEFRLRFKNSPIWRATRDGLVRNVAVALGNCGANEATPALAGALQDASPLVRAHAAWALGRISTGRAFQILKAARCTEKDPAVLEEIMAAGENS